MESSPQKEVFSIEEFCIIYGVKRNRFFTISKNGELRITKMGRRTMIARQDADHWLQTIRSQSQ